MLIKSLFLLGWFSANISSQVNTFELFRMRTIFHAIYIVFLFTNNYLYIFLFWSIELRLQMRFFSCDLVFRLRGFNFLMYRYINRRYGETITPLSETGLVRTNSCFWIHFVSSRYDFYTGRYRQAANHLTGPRLANNVARRSFLVELALPFSEWEGQVRGVYMFYNVLLGARRQSQWQSTTRRPRKLRTLQTDRISAKNWRTGVKQTPFFSVSQAAPYVDARRIYSRHDTCLHVWLRDTLYMHYKKLIKLTLHMKQYVPKGLKQTSV